MSASGFISFRALRVLNVAIATVHRWSCVPCRLRRQKTTTASSRKTEGKSEVLRSARLYLRAQSLGHHPIDRQEERGVEGRISRRFFLKGRERAIVNQTNIESASKATLGKPLRDGVEAPDDVPWKDETGLSWVRRTLQLLQKQRWGNFWEMVSSVQGLFRAHRYPLELSKTGTPVNKTERWSVQKVETQRLRSGCTHTVF